MPRRLPYARLWLAFMACSAGCGSSNDAPSDVSVNDVSCSADPRLDAYAGELDKPGELGVLSFRFFGLEPNPPAKGSNTFHVQVSDAEGQVMQAGLRLDLRMPDHGHGTSVEPVISFDAALGAYTITPVFLFMPGVWRLEFEAVDGSDESLDVDGQMVNGQILDSTVLHFCVEG